MSGSALELALALHRIPSMRRALRERPLPHDVGELLTLVGGSPAALADAAGHCGEAPATVLEAARFFVQEVLLFPGADAYRVLGLDPLASDGRIKAHYRALQHWLHPDRRGSDLESAYATRINGAWSQLRSPDRRRAYDSAHVDGSESVPVAVHAARVRVSGWGGAEAERTAPWKWIAPAAAALALCVWLGWMASRESSTPGETNERDASAQPGRAGEAEIALIARTAPHSRVAATATPLPPPAPSTARRPPPPPRLPMSTSPREVRLASVPLPDPPVCGATAPVAAARRPVIPSLPPRQPSPMALTVSAPRTETPPPAEAPAAAVPTGAAMPVTAVLASPTPRAPSDALARAQTAERRADELWAYLAGKRRTPPPIWRDAMALDAADRVRRDLIEAPRTHRSRLAFSSAQWQIGEDTARVRVRIGTARGSDAGGDAVHAKFGWRDGQWWVEQVALEESE